MKTGKLILLILTLNSFTYLSGLTQSEPLTREQIQILNRFRIRDLQKNSLLDSLLVQRYQDSVFIDAQQQSLVLKHEMLDTSEAWRKILQKDLNTEFQSHQKTKKKLKKTFYAIPISLLLGVTIGLLLN